MVHTLSQLARAITPKLLHAVLILSRIRRLSSLRAAYGHFFERNSCIEFSQSASLSRQWETHKGLPILTSTNELSLRKSPRCIPDRRTISRVDIRSLIDLLQGVSLADEHRRLVIPWSFANTMQLCHSYRENSILSMSEITTLYATFIYNSL